MKRSRLTLAFTLSNLAIMSFATSVSFAAVVFDPANQPIDTLAPYELSDNDLASGNTKAYRPWFENGSWQGDLIEYDVSPGGVLSTTIDTSTNPPTQTGAPGNWSARLQFNEAITAVSTYWRTKRKIITYNGSIQRAFVWGNLPSAKQKALDNTTFTLGKTGDYDSPVLNFIRGDQSNELDNGGGYRNRFNILGDIIHSNPVHVAAPKASFSLAGYSDYKNKLIADGGQADRAPRVYVGSNDGMVHAFDAETGNEVYAYIPSMIIDDLNKLLPSPFDHHYFVDGQLSAGDANFGTDLSPDWRTVLVGGLGSGGKGLFALDITNPDLTNEGSNTGGDRKVLWEKDGSDNDMGHIYGKYEMALLPDNKWYMVGGNGYGSNNGLAVLFLIDPATGVKTEINTDLTTGNGLGAPTLVDVNNDFKVDVAYAGDLKGNVWRFDLKTLTVSKLFAAGVNKPITTAFDVTRHPNGGVIVFFGTGSLLSASDSKNTNTQTVYGIWDDNSATQVPNNTTVILEQTLGVDTYSNGGTDITVRTSTNYPINWSTHKGWQVDLNISGERLVNDPLIRAGRMQMVTTKPYSNPKTEVAGNGWLLELNYLSGGSGDQVFFDLNTDSVLDDADKVGSDIPVGIYLGTGSFSGPEIGRIKLGRDSMFINGLLLPVLNDTSGGLLGGHMDVDTDSPDGLKQADAEADRYCYYDGSRGNDPVDSSGDPTTVKSKYVVRPKDDTSFVGSIDGYGGEVDNHQHEYDKAHGTVVHDFFDTEPLCSQPRPDTGKKNAVKKLSRVTEVANLDGNDEFFIIIANADLSPGSTFRIGNKEWNVVVYQRMIEESLENWKKAGYAGDPVDYNGDSLIFTLDDIRAVGGTISHSFGIRAIIDGGLLPTVYDCVTGGKLNAGPYYTMDDPSDTKDDGANRTLKNRWRGGALVTQIISKSEYLSDPDTVRKQIPSDLYRERVLSTGTTVVLKEDTNLNGTLDAGEDTNGNGVIDTYGGLIANDYYKVAGVVTKNPAFMYETALYWHFPTSNCYGNVNWEADVKGAASSSTSSKSVKNTVAALEVDLSNAEQTLQEMINDGADAKDIAAQEALIDKIKEKIKAIKKSLNDDSVANTGVPVVPTDITPPVDPTLGPNFRPGRRTWIDLSPF